MDSNNINQQWPNIGHFHLYNIAQKRESQSEVFVTRYGYFLNEQFWKFSMRDDLFQQSLKNINSVELKTYYSLHYLEVVFIYRLSKIKFLIPIPENKLNEFQNLKDALFSIKLIQ